MRNNRYYTGVKKKIRSWKRRVRQIEEWGENIKEPNIDWFIHRRLEKFTGGVIYHPSIKPQKDIHQYGFTKLSSEGLYKLIKLEAEI